MSLSLVSIRFFYSISIDTSINIFSLTSFSLANKSLDFVLLSMAEFNGICYFIGERFSYQTIDSCDKIPSNFLLPPKIDKDYSKLRHFDLVLIGAFLLSPIRSFCAIYFCRILSFFCGILSSSDLNDEM